MRRLISEEEFEIRNTLITEKLYSFFRDIQSHCIHSFLPIKKNKEPDTMRLIQFLREEQKEVVVSKSDFENYTMKHFLYDDELVLEVNSYGIPEPIDGVQVSVEEIEIVLVPLLSFDKEGHRLGYGKGFYDRFLAEVNPEAKKIGISLAGPFDSFHFVEPHDIALDYCVTPFELYKFI